VWCLLENVAALLQIEEDLATSQMPERPTSAKAVKESMLLEGKAKVLNLWKLSELMTLKEVTDKSEGEYHSTCFDGASQQRHAEMRFRREMLLEILVMEESVKGMIRSWTIEPNMKDFMEPWFCEAELRNVRKDFVRTVHLLNFHMVLWGRSSDSSELRSRKETIASAMCKYAAIIEYCMEMLRKEGSATGWLRHYVENLLSFALIPRKG